MPPPTPKGDSHGDNSPDHTLPKSTASKSTIAQPTPDPVTPIVDLQSHGLSSQSHQSSKEIEPVQNQAANDIVDGHGSIPAANLPGKEQQHFASPVTVQSTEPQLAVLLPDLVHEIQVQAVEGLDGADTAEGPLTSDSIRRPSNLKTAPHQSAGVMKPEKSTTGQPVEEIQQDSGVKSTTRSTSSHRKEVMEKEKRSSTREEKGKAIVNLQRSEKTNHKDESPIHSRRHGGLPREGEWSYYGESAQQPGREIPT